MTQIVWTYAERQPAAATMPNFAEQFMALALPPLQRGDAEELSRTVQKRFTALDIAQLLRHERVDVRQVAALTLGMLGGADAVGVMARALHDEEPDVVEMAEHGLWSIWFRLGKPAANESFARGVELLGEDRLDEARQEFSDAIDLDPEFAEARNQLAITHYLIGNYESSIRACEFCVSLMPCHFGATAGMGHACVQLGRLSDALQHYRRAKAIYPAMPGLQEHLASLQERLKDASTPSPLSDDDDSAWGRVSPPRDI
ncbi:MAG: tetratricopeptide repeat protein [Planctomycetota bacterium]